MAEKTRTNKSEGSPEGAGQNAAAGSLPAIIFSILLFLLPLFPDIRLTRPKLMVLEFGLYGILFIWLAINLYSGKLTLKNTPLLLPIACYLLFVSVYYYFSADRPVALSELKRALLSFAGFFVASNVLGTEKQRRAVLGSWILGGALAVGYGILQHFGGIKAAVLVPQMERVMSTFGNPIFFAAFLVVTIPVALGVLFSSEKRAMRALIAAFVLLSLFALFYTKTRAAYIGFAVSLIVFFWITIRSRRLKLIMLTALIVISGFFVYKTKNIWLRDQAHSLIWRDTLTMWSTSPLFGTGLGTFHIYFPRFASEELKHRWPQGQAIVNDAHNEFIQYLGETGIIGFGIFLWVLIAFFYNAVSVMQKTSGNARYVQAGLVASASGILAQNFFSADMRFIISAAYLFIVMGIFESYKERSWKIEIRGEYLKVFSFIVLALLAYFAFSETAKPYLAEKKVAATPDFFDQKILEPAKTAASLEDIAIKFPKQATVFEKLGWVYSKEKDWKKAIANYERAAELDPNNAGNFNNLGNIYFLLGNRQKAVECWAESIVINPEQVDSRLNLAIAYYSQGRLKEAVDQLKEVLKIDPNNEKAIVMLKQMTE